MKAIHLVLALAIALPPSPAAAAPSATPTGVDEPRDGAPELWERLCRAMLLRRSSEAQPVTAFDLTFNVLMREPGSSKELTPRIRFLAPAYLRFELPDGAEVRGPDGYWREDGAKVEDLAARDYNEDRRQIDQRLLTVRNFVALTQPGALDIEGLALLAEPPAEIGKGHDFARARYSRRMVWIEFLSRDFQLALPPTGARPTPPAPQRVRIGIDRESALPVLALISDPAGASAPLLLHLDDVRPLDDIRVPHAVRMYQVIPPNGFGPTLESKPRLELYIVSGTVRAAFTADDFRRP